MNKTILAILMFLFTLSAHAEKIRYNKPEYWQLIHSEPDKGRALYGNTLIRSLSPQSLMIEIRYKEAKSLPPNKTMDNQGHIIGKDYTKVRFKLLINCENKKMSYEDCAFFDSREQLSAYVVLSSEESQWFEIKDSLIAEKLYRFTCEF